MSWEIDFLNELSKLHNIYLDKVMILFSKMGSGGIIFIILGLIFLFNKKNREMGITLIISLVLCGILGNGIIKPLVGRVRPYVTEGISIIISPPSGASFPSGHTYSAFAAAMVIYMYNKKIGKIMFVFAIIMGFSRMYLYVHYPTDVIVGAILGMLLGYCSYYLVNIIKKTKD